MLNENRHVAAKSMSFTSIHQIIIEIPCKKKNLQVVEKKHDIPYGKKISKKKQLQLHVFIKAGFSFSYTGSLTKFKYFSLTSYSPLAEGRSYGFMPFFKALPQRETKTASSKIWTLITASISYDDRHSTKRACVCVCVCVCEFMYVCMCVDMCVYANVSLCMCVSVHVYIRVCVAILTKAAIIFEQQKTSSFIL